MSKGAETHRRILDRALKLASTEGLEGVTIGNLATDLGMSKSGLFAHFTSKEQLQLEVLEETAARFEDNVIRPALKAPRGEPRLRALFEGWLAWLDQKKLPGGCIFIAAAAELDDKPGPVRDYLVKTQKQLLDAIARALQLCVEEKHFKRDVDVRQLAFELHALVFAYHHHARLLRDRSARQHVRNAFERLVESARR